MKKLRTWIVTPLLGILLATTSCAPITETTPPTGKNVAGTLGGAAVGAGVTAALNAPAPVVGVAGVAGASLGYYLTTLSFSAGGIIRGGGKVYTVGQYLTIEYPSDNLFDANTNEFLDNAEPVLNSIASVLARYPEHNLIISADTSGFGTGQWDQKLSQARAEQVASYLWMHGITNTLPNPVTGRTRRLIYVGYGDHFPIANTIRLSGIRANSRIQIVAYPFDEVLHWDTAQKSFKLFDNIGAVDPADSHAPPPNQDYADEFDDNSNTTPSAPQTYASAFGGNHAKKPAPTTYAKAFGEAPNPPPLANVPMPPKDLATANADTLKQDINALPTPDQNPKPDLLPELQAKLSSHSKPAAAPAPQNSAASAPQTVVGANVKKHWGSHEDVNLHDETPASLPAPDPDALSSAR